MRNFRCDLASSLIGATLALAVVTSPAHAAAVPEGAQAAAATIDGRRIAEHVKFLSSDLLEGRGTGARGGDIAADYIATQFALDGLQPAGDNGGYLQQVKFTGITTQGSNAQVSLVPDKGAAMPLTYADDYVLTDKTGAASQDIDAPIVFVGFGIQAPEYGWDDFKGVDVKGKMLLLFVNEPESNDLKFFNGPALTYYGRWTYKYEEAARLGAVGALIIHRTDLASYPWQVVRSSWTGEDVELANDTDPKVKAAAWIQLEVARKLFAAGGQDLDAMYKAANSKDFKPIELPAHFKAKFSSDVRSFQSSNVVAMLPGASAGAPKQVVMYSAHYDHLGMIPGKGDDTIYNGAVDNGTGCGILLEMAHAFSLSKIKPPHPILFVAVTAEEKGLLGSNYFGKHPPVPAKDIALDLNYDAILPVGEPESVDVSGAERTSFYPTVSALAQQLHLDIEADAHPGAGHYYRSDHFSMARVGVPSFSINEGAKYAGHPREWGVAAEDFYTENHYHQPSDEFSDAMDWRGNVKLARFGLELGWLASMQTAAIGWQPGDEFEKLRKN